MAWLVVATILGVLIGRMIRQRDRHVLQDDPASPVHDIRIEEEADRAARGVPGAAGRDRPRS